MEGIVIYDSFNKYVESCTTLKSRLAAIDAIIEVLLTTAIKSAGTDNMQEYSLNDGQTIIKVIYKGADQIAKSIKDWQTIRVMYENQLNGYAFKLHPKENFI